MPYDPALDEKLFNETKEFDGTRINVSVFSYNGGEKKLQIGRENLDQNDQWRFNKLGRMNKAEAEAVLPAIQQAIENM